MPNQGLLAITFFEASAFSILLFLYLVLYRDMPARFLRLWLAGWALFTAYGAAQIVYVVRGGLTERVAMLECHMAGLVLFLAVVLVYTGRERWLACLWPLAALGALWVGFGERTQILGQLVRVTWPTAVLESAILLTAGWILWRYARPRSGHGAVLLAAALLLGGLHGLDQPLWGTQPIFLLRVAFDDLLELALGIAMAVLVLETARVRTEDLNDKLRRLTLITAASTQTFNVDDVLSEVLRHLVESLNASHGLVRLLAGEGDSAQLVIRASVGFTESFLEKHACISANEPWARKVLQQNAPFLSYEDERHPEVRQRMEAESISAMILVRLPGNETPLGVLAVGSRAPRRFQGDEINFLFNVANLLGLTIQNVSLFEHAAGAERQWMYTFDSIGDPILVHDQECRIVRGNQALGDRLGVAWDALLGRSVAEVFRRGANRWERCPYCEGAAGKGDEVDPNLGGIFLVSNSGFHAAGGERLGTIHVLKDITERKRAEEKYRNLIANLQEGVFISTPEGRFLDFNDAFMRMLGFESRKDLLNVDIASSIFVSAADRERLKKLLREHGAVTDFEFQMRRRDGEVLTVLESSFATRDESGAITAFQGFVLDITERKRAEQEIRRRNRELMVLNSIGQTLSQSLELYEMLGRALRQVVELFGADAGEIYLLEDKSRVLRRAAAVGHRSEYARHFPPTALPSELLDHIRAVRATVLSTQSLPLPPVFRDLQQKEGIKISHVVVLWSKDRIVGALIVGSRRLREFSGAELNLLTSVGSQIAVTIEKMLLHEETRQAYESLRRTQEQLLQSEKMAAVGQLISGVAHELNNPLTAILGYSQLLASNDHVSSRGAEYVDKLYKQAQRTHRIVHNLLSFARQQKPERLPVRLNQILEDTLALREYDLRVNNIQVHRELAAGLPLTAADAHQLQQVFLNILNNAVDAILERSDRGEIWVRSGLEDGRLSVEFTDSGSGVHDALRVFDPFYTTKPVGKGTGLGLSICYGIVTEHGGEIAVRNSPPLGATFAISLPVMPVGEPREVSVAGADRAPSGGRVLLVDDEEAVLELEQEILTGRCRSVRAARSGREAQQLLEKEPVDLVVTDLKMPGEVTGRELYHWICRHHPELAGRVVFTMSDARTEEVGTLLEESGCPFIQKPFEVERFLGVIRRALSQANTSVIKR
jgi:PAS domain S-box-containing protein